MKIFIYAAFAPTLQSTLRSLLPAESEITFKNDIPENQLISAFHSAEIILGNPPVTWFQEPPANLVFWQLDSAGFDQYKSIKLTVPVANMGGFYAQQCAETMVGGVLAFYRGIHRLVNLQRLKKWEGKQIRPSLELLGTKKALLLGSGEIGLAIKKMLIGFGCQVKMAARRNPIADFHSFDQIMNALPATDLVINTLPGTADKFVSTDFFNAMRHGSLYANVGRGNTTDEAALLIALTSGKLEGAVLDVTEAEPLSVESPLWEMENVILTQHTGGGNKNEEEAKANLFISNVNNFLTHQEIQNQIELTAGY